MSRLAARSEGRVKFEYDTEEQLIGIVNERGHVRRLGPSDPCTRAARACARSTLIFLPAPPQRDVPRDRVGFDTAPVGSSPTSTSHDGLARAARALLASATTGGLSAIFADTSAYFGGTLDALVESRFSNFKDDLAVESLKVRSSPLLDPYLISTYKWNINEDKRFGLIRNDITWETWTDTRFLNQALKDLGLEGYWKLIDQSGNRKTAPSADNAPATAASAPPNG